MDDASWGVQVLKNLRKPEGFVSGSFDRALHLLIDFIRAFFDLGANVRLSLLLEIDFQAFGRFFQTDLFEPHFFDQLRFFGNLGPVEGTLLFGCFELGFEFMVTFLKFLDLAFHSLDR